MNWERFAGNWQRVKGVAQEQWGRLTRDYGAVIAGSRQRLLGKSRAAQGVVKEANEQQLADWRSRQHKADPIHK